MLGLQPKHDGSKSPSAMVPFLARGLPVLFFFSLFLCTNFLEIFSFSSHVKLQFSVCVCTVTGGTALLGGYGERFRDPVTHLLDSPGKVSITGKCRTCGGCILEQNESEGSVGRGFCSIKWVR